MITGRNPKISVDELLADGSGKFPLGKLDALYKYVKHLVIPKLERDHPKEGIEKGINVIELLLDYIRRHEDSPSNRTLLTQDWLYNIRKRCYRGGGY